MYSASPWPFRDGINGLKPGGFPRPERARAPSPSAAAYPLRSPSQLVRNLKGYFIPGSEREAPPRHEGSGRFGASGFQSGPAYVGPQACGNTEWVGSPFASAAQNLNDPSRMPEAAFLSSEQAQAFGPSPWATEQNSCPSPWNSGVHWESSTSLPAWSEGSQPQESRPHYSGYKLLNPMTGQLEAIYQETRWRPDGSLDVRFFTEDFWGNRQECLDPNASVETSQSGVYRMPWYEDGRQACSSKSSVSKPLDRERSPSPLTRQSTGSTSVPSHEGYGREGVHTDSLGGDWEPLVSDDLAKSAGRGTGQGPGSQAPGAPFPNRSRPVETASRVSTESTEESPAPFSARSEDSQIRGSRSHYSGYKRLNSVTGQLEAIYKETRRLSDGSLDVRFFTEDCSGNRQWCLDPQIPMMSSKIGVFRSPEYEDPANRKEFGSGHRSDSQTDEVPLSNRGMSGATASYVPSEGSEGSGEERSASPGRLSSPNLGPSSRAQGSQEVEDTGSGRSSEGREPAELSPLESRSREATAGQAAAATRLDFSRGPREVPVLITPTGQHVYVLQVDPIFGPVCAVLADDADRKPTFFGEYQLNYCKAEKFNGYGPGWAIEVPGGGRLRYGSGLPGCREWLYERESQSSGWVNGVYQTRSSYTALEPVPGRLWELEGGRAVPAGWAVAPSPVLPQQVEWGEHTEVGGDPSPRSVRCICLTTHFGQRIFKVPLKGPDPRHFEMAWVALDEDTHQLVPCLTLFPGGQETILTPSGEELLLSQTKDKEKLSCRSILPGSVQKESRPVTGEWKCLKFYSTSGQFQCEAEWMDYFRTAPRRLLNQLNLDSRTDVPQCSQSQVLFGVLSALNSSVDFGELLDTLRKADQGVVPKRVIKFKLLLVTHPDKFALESKKRSTDLFNALSSRFPSLVSGGRESEYKAAVEEWVQAFYTQLTKSLVDIMNRE